MSLYCFSPIMEIVAGLVGFVLGLMYFYGAYQTAMALHKQEAPMAVLIGSFIGRTFVVGLVFYLLVDGCASRLLIMFVGFLLGRFIFMTKVMRELEKKQKKSSTTKVMETVNSLKDVKR